MSGLIPLSPSSLARILALPSSPRRHPGTVMSSGFPSTFPKFARINHRPIVPFRKPLTSFLPAASCLTV
eukprot:8401495-Pyramimonas_sp.AAC.1